MIFQSATFLESSTEAAFIGMLLAPPLPDMVEATTPYFCLTTLIATHLVQSLHSPLLHLKFEIFRPKS